MGDDGRTVTEQDGNIRVLLGDDNVLVREGVRALLSATDGIEVVGVAEDAPSLIAAAGELQPDVVVTDIKMPPNFQLEGIEARRTAYRRALHQHRVLMFSRRGLGLVGYLRSVVYSHEGKVHTASAESTARLDHNACCCGPLSP